MLHVGSAKGIAAIRSAVHTQLSEVVRCTHSHTHATYSTYCMCVPNTCHTPYPCYTSITHYTPLQALPPCYMSHITLLLHVTPYTPVTCHTLHPCYMSHTTPLSHVTHYTPVTCHTPELSHTAPKHHPSLHVLLFGNSEGGGTYTVPHQSAHVIQ